MKAKFVNEAIKHLKPRSKEEVRANLKNSIPKIEDIVSLLWDFWNQSRIKNSIKKDFHDSRSDFEDYCDIWKSEIDKINAHLK